MTPPNQQTPTPRTNDIVRYLNEQFPATVGHIPIREKIGQLELERNEINRQVMGLQELWDFVPGVENKYIDRLAYHLSEHIQQLQKQNQELRDALEIINNSKCNVYFSAEERQIITTAITQ